MSKASKATNSSFLSFQPFLWDLIQQEGRPWDPSSPLPQSLLGTVCTFLPDSEAHTQQKARSLSTVASPEQS